ncbi:MAG: hypothetical protein M1826_004165 [Phylliscum demangeonii]|nr:MAG: hypothetical protein M1826_004165 [Phylliscum demangeonii]
MSGQEQQGEVIFHFSLPHHTQPPSINGNHKSQNRPPEAMPNQDHPQAWVKMYRTEIAASVSSVLSTSASYPLDSIKTRMQAYGFRSVTGCIRHSYQTEGLKGFWRGSAAPLFSVTLVRTASFSVYQKAKYLYAGWLQGLTGTSPLVHVNTPGTYPNLATALCFGAAGATAGAAVSTIACPFELTKLSAQISVLMAKTKASSLDDSISRSYQKKGTFGTAANIIKHRGVLGLYSGFRLHLLRDVAGTAVYFATYESCKQVAGSAFNTTTASSPAAVAVAGAMCGLVSWACIYPIDSVKSVYQRNCLMHGRGEPVNRPKIEFFNRNSYRGLSVSMGRSCVVNVIFFSMFEFVKRRINALED